MKQKILFLDDDLIRHDAFRQRTKDMNVEVTYIETVEQAIKALTNFKFDIASLDHDLGGQVYVKETEGTGYEVALFIEEKLEEDKLPNEVIVHSYNPAGAERMVYAIKKRIAKCVRQPF